jgi:zinc transporter 1/2/3
MLSALGMHLIEWLAMFWDPVHDEHKEGECKSSEDTETSDPSSSPAPTRRHDHDHHGHSHSRILEARKQKVSTYTLEFGISIHSVIIGVSLGVNKDEFVALFIAISFHQFFEGIGLGSVLSDLQFSKKYQFVVWLSVLVYSLTTPLGIGIGIIIYHNTFNATSQLIISGVLDAVSSGILLYTALVTLLANAFQSPRFVALSRLDKVICFICLYAGTAAMAIIGIWA